MTSPSEEGDPNSRICFVGEAPSTVEVKLNRPLVGPSGQVFNDCLREAGIPRASCYVLNVFEGMVRKTEKGDIFDEHGTCLFQAGRGYTAAGREAAQPFLARLGQSTANVVCPMGNTALNLLFGEHSIQKWRGSTVESVTLPRRKLLPTYHPAFLLRGSMLYKYVVIHDMKRIAEESAFPELRLPERNLRINPTLPEVLAYLEHANSVRMVATDIEVLNRQVSCFSVAISPQDCMCIPLLDERAHARWGERDEMRIWEAYARVMGNSAITKVNQNLLFDIQFLFQQNSIVTRGPIGDTMVAQSLMYPDFPKGLDFICSIRSKEPFYKDDGKLWSKPWVDMERFWLYNARDSVVAMEAWLDMQQELDDGYRDTYNNTIDLFDSLLYMMTHGIKVNSMELERLKDASQEGTIAYNLKIKELELQGIAEEPFNPYSPKQVANYFYGVKSIKPYISTKTHQPTTDDKALARIWKRYGFREAKLIQEIRALSKLLNTYIEVLYDADQRIRCSYNIRGTTTGRLSSTQTVFGGGLNLQNLPMEFKTFLEADGD